MDTILNDYLKKHKILFKEYLHPAIFKVSDGLELKKTIPGLHCKTLFLKDEKGQFYLVGMPALKQLDIKNMQKRLGIKKLRFATTEELLNETALKPGSVSIFGIIHSKQNRVTLVIDKEVWSSELIGFHPNANTSTFVLTHEALEKFYNLLLCPKHILDNEKKQ